MKNTIIKVLPVNDYFPPGFLSKKAYRTLTGINGTSKYLLHLNFPFFGWGFLRNLSVFLKFKLFCLYFN